MTSDGAQYETNLWPSTLTTSVSGWKLSRRVHDGGPEEVHQRHEEGLHQEAAQGFAEALLEASGLCLFRRHQQEVRHDHHGVHRS